MAFYLLMAACCPPPGPWASQPARLPPKRNRGSLTPRSATPASNTSIFTGKVAGAVLPALTLSLVNVVAYLVVMALLFGPASLGLLPVGFSLLMLAVFAGAVALVFVASVVLVLISARTWRREEVMARRDA
ncbi:MAG: hypothetical protein ACM30E_03860 [Nitrososphaerales archaeon]